MNSIYKTWKTIQNKHFINNIVFCMMSKQKQRKGSKQATTDEPKKEDNNNPVLYDSSKNVLIKVLAKPGAKQNSITDISTEGIGVQINASPIEGQANTELVKYISTVLGIRKGDITLVKGSKSRQKTLSILNGTTNVEDVLEKFRVAQNS